jgi:tetratricopeptide (TPR) repeat protein
VEALSAAPADQLEQSAPDDQERAFWVAASEDAARAAVRSGRPECALLILAIAGRWDEAESVFRNAAAADRGRLLLARAAAAVRAERWADAAESYRLADEVASSREEARRRLSALQSQCREALDRARGCCAAGRLDDAIRLYEKALRLQPEDAERWNEAAWTLSTAPGVTAAQGRVACAWAKAAVETHRRAFPGEGSTLSLYLDTLAAAHFAAGEFEDAVRVEREALALPVPERFLRDMKDALEKYEKAAR